MNTLSVELIQILSLMLTLMKRTFKYGGTNDPAFKVTGEMLRDKLIQIFPLPVPVVNTATKAVDIVKPINLQNMDSITLQEKYPLKDDGSSYKWWNSPYWRFFWYIQHYAEQHFPGEIHKHKIDLIKEYRTITGLGLKDAKNDIEKWIREFEVKAY